MSLLQQQKMDTNMFTPVLPGSSIGHPKAFTMPQTLSQTAQKILMTNLIKVDLIQLQEQL